MVLKGQAYFLTDFRYTEAAERVITSCKVVEYSRIGPVIVDLLKKHGATGRILMEKDVYKRQNDALCGIGQRIRKNQKQIFDYSSWLFGTGAKFYARRDTSADDGMVLGVRCALYPNGRQRESV